jgi:hypothetical protein
MTPILLLEINEVPWRLVDRYREQPGFPNLRRFFAGAHQLTTVAVGMANDLHGIRNLGQDPATFLGKPIWEDVRDRGAAIGICGSMQSWPPRDPGAGGFFIPDTFAHDASCIPADLSPFQAFNLEQVRSNARVVKGSLPRARGKAALVRSMIGGGVCLRTLLRVAAQLAHERIDPDIRQRRPVYQAVLFWDVFRKLFDPRNPPAFSTFFTNHVAGVMHRFWSDVFPEDFPDGKPDRRSHEPLMRFALSVLDDILAEAMSWAEKNPELVVVFASSMGQAAVHRSGHIGVELVVDDLGKLMASVGLRPHEYTPLLAMVPQVALEVPDAVRRRAAKAALEAARTADGDSFIAVQETGNSLSVTVATSSKAALQGSIRIDGRERTWEEAGIRQEQVDAGTGYHIPEGSLAIFSARNAAPLIQDRRRVRADCVKPWLLDVLEKGPACIARVADAAEERTPAGSHVLAS